MLTWEKFFRYLENYFIYETQENFSGNVLQKNVTTVRTSVKNQGFDCFEKYYKNKF